ncbi:cytochrome P450 [Phlebopus sp. FC_14]|nr:cytochrome P450 [Phlebopus sp. FC_14]
MTGTGTILSLTTLCMLFAAGIWVRIRTQKRNPYPPGPKGLPLIGSVLEMNLNEPQLTYAEWGKKYGDIVHTRVLGQDFIIVNSETSARLLADWRSAIYSGRPQSSLFKLVAGASETLPLTLRADAADKYQALYTSKAHNLVKNLRRDGDSSRLDKHLQLYAASLVLEVTYGEKVDDLNDRLVVMARGLNDVLVKEVTTERKTQQNRLRAGVYLAGAETTTSTLQTFILAMLLHPDVQVKAQLEMDTVLGKDVLPTLKDKPRLPYLQAVVYETMRWSPVIPLGLPHAATMDDDYNGYFIPKGRSWSSTSDGQLSPEAKQANSVFFGFGRRVFPGRFFSDNAVWSAVAMMLSTLRFEKAQDTYGNDIAVEPVFTQGVAV